MKVSAIDRELLKYFTRLNESQKKSLIDLIKTFLSATNYESANRISIEAYNKELNEAMERVSKGEYSTIEELEKEMESW